MDALAVSLALGAAEGARMNGGKVLTVSLFFGGFQALMPLAGWFACGFLSGFDLHLERFLAAGLLWLIGGKMIWDRNQEEKIAFGIRELLLLAVATSIDAFLVGISFACLGRTAIWSEIILIGMTTFLISGFGCIAGKYSRKLFGRYCILTGGIVLIAIGTKILFFG